jgi:hypothetical protein
MHGVLWSIGEANREEETKMSAEENKALVRREQEELWNHTGDLDAAEELFAAGQAEAAKRWFHNPLRKRLKHTRAQPSSRNASWISALRS